jgi:hypothetical protein
MLVGLILFGLVGILVAVILLTASDDEDGEDARVGPVADAGHRPPLEGRPWPEIDEAPSPPDGAPEPSRDGGADAGARLPLRCRVDSDCVVAINYNYCCPCATATLVEIVEAQRCVFVAEGAPERPEGCGLACNPAICEPCRAQGTAAECVDGECVTLYPGECRPGEEGCGRGRVCVLAEGEARCVPDPNECHTDDDCPRPGWECRDWQTSGILSCWHPDSACWRHFDCPYNHFCEDPDGDGVFECIDGSPDCRPEYRHVECPPGMVCEDPDGDGRGSCVEE